MREESSRNDADVFFDTGEQAFRALQTAYIRLLQNPFYTPDDHTPMSTANGKGKGGEITSPRFIAEVRRIGEKWRPGMGVV